MVFDRHVTTVVQLDFVGPRLRPLCDWTETRLLRPLSLSDSNIGERDAGPMIPLVVTVAYRPVD
jgi:hypothetical protein